MAKTLTEKIKYFFGFEAEDNELLEGEYDAEYQGDHSEHYTSSQSQLASNASSNRVVNIHNNAKIKIDIYRPNNFEAAVEVVECLRQKRPVVINLESIEPEMARKIFDFLSGALCAMDGKAEKISKGIFVMAPKNVEIQSASQDITQEKADIFEFTDE